MTATFQAIVLKVADGAVYADVAAEMGIPEGTIAPMIKASRAIAAAIAEEEALELAACNTRFVS